MQGEGAIPVSKNRAQVVNMNDLNNDVELGANSPRKGGKREMNVGKFMIILGFCIWISCLFFFYTFRPARMVKAISPPTMIWGTGKEAGSPQAVILFLVSGIAMAIIIILWFLEPLMMRIVGDWVYDVNDGSGIGGCFARGIPCCRPPPGTADAMQYKGKLMFALMMAILIVEIPMGVFVFGNKNSPLSLMNNPEKGFPIDGNVILNYKCTHYDIGCELKQIPTMCRDPVDTWNKFQATISAENCAEGYDFDASMWKGNLKCMTNSKGLVAMAASAQGSETACTAKGGYWHDTGFTGVSGKVDQACSSMGPFGSGKCKMQTMMQALAYCGWTGQGPPCGPPRWDDVTAAGCSDGCEFSQKWAMYKPSPLAKTMVQYEQGLNAPGFFFLDLVINLPIIMYLAFPLTMGPLSCLICGKWTTTPGCDPTCGICGCMDGEEIRRLRANA